MASLDVTDVLDRLLKGTASKEDQELAAMAIGILIEERDFWKGNYQKTVESVRQAAIHLKAAMLDEARRLASHHEEMTKSVTSIKDKLESLL